MWSVNLNSGAAPAQQQQPQSPPQAPGDGNSAAAASVASLPSPSTPGVAVRRLSLSSSASGAAALAASGAAPSALTTLASSGVIANPPSWVDSVQPHLHNLPGVGPSRFEATRELWRQVGPRGMTPIAKPEMNADDILDAIEETPGNPLRPAVHLPLMIDCLIELWEEEGLYD